MCFNKFPYFIVVASFLLVSCSVFSPVKAVPTNSYVLDMVPVVHATKRGAHGSILVNYPQVSPMNNTTQMAYSTEPFQVAYFAKNQWADTPSQMLQPMIVQTLQETHYFSQVVSSGMMGQYDYILNTQLIELRQVFKASSCRIHLRLKAQIVEAGTGRIIATKDFIVFEPAQPTPYGGVVAANKAVLTLLTQLAQFTMRI